MYRNDNNGVRQSGQVLHCVVQRDARRIEARPCARVAEQTAHPVGQLCCDVNETGGVAITVGTRTGMPGKTWSHSCCTARSHITTFRGKEEWTVLANG
jgi:hypothetical protein